MSQEDLTNMENHIIVLLISGVLALGGWNLYATNSLQSITGSNHEHLSGEIRIVDVKVDSLKENFNIRTLDRYTGAAAARDKALIMGEINLLKLKCDSLQKRIKEKHPINGAP